VPRVEVRFRNLTVSTEVHYGRRALPTLLNYVHDIAEVYMEDMIRLFLFFFTCWVGQSADLLMILICLLG
jgi:hypothetical protein